MELLCRRTVQPSYWKSFLHQCITSYAAPATSSIGSSNSRLFHCLSRSCSKDGAHSNTNNAGVARRNADYEINSKYRHLHCLARNDRRLVHVRGAEAAPFLQGLITNDMQHLLDGSPSMYAMILNSQGRVLHDIIIYNNKAQGELQDFLLEVENDAAEQLERHLKMYRLRKKIEINLCTDKKCWVLFDPELDFKCISEVDIECLYLSNKIDSKAELNISNDVDDMIITRDPRMKYLGHKVILPNDKDACNILPDLVTSNIENYRNLRYRLGVAEGPDELPQGKVMPLEANVDYLHGISFHKGCYVGQELTARTFHTGVVRKRYMPIVLTDLPSKPIAAETSVVNAAGKSVGRVRAHAGTHGVALLRIAQSVEDKAVLTVAGCPVDTFKPAWWPIEAVKKVPDS